MATNAQIHELADDLQGTCQTLEQVQERLGIGELTVADHQYLDSLVFLCDRCGWWCEACEESREFPGTCDDCNPDEEEDD